MNSIVSLFRCLGDETRFRIVCQLYRRDSYVELLANQLGLTAGTISFHLKKMEAEGLVKCSRTQFYIIYSLNRACISKTIESYITAYELPDDHDAYREKVLSSFFDGERLRQIPVQQKKREIILSEIMKAFDADKSYSEKEVNAVLLQYYEDFCALRRWLIDTGFMSRDSGTYRVLKK